MDIINKLDKILLIQIEENNYNILFIILDKLKYKSEITILINIETIINKSKLLESLMYIREEYINQYERINIMNIEEFNEYEKYDSIIFLKNSDIKYYDTKYKYYYNKIENKLKFGIMYDREINYNNFINISLIPNIYSKNIYIEPIIRVKELELNKNITEEHYLIYDISNKINYDMVHLITKILKIKITIITEKNINYKELNENINIVTNISTKELIEYLKNIRSVIIVPNKIGEIYYEKTIPEILYLSIYFKIPVILSQSIYEINKDLINNTNNNIKVYNTLQDILFIISELSNITNISLEIKEKIEIKNNKRLIIETEEINDIKNNEGTDDIKNSEVKEEIKDIINNEDKNKEILDKINPMIELHNKKDELKAMVMSRILENNLIVNNKINLFGVGVNIDNLFKTNNNNEIKSDNENNMPVKNIVRINNNELDTNMIGMSAIDELKNINRYNKVNDMNDINTMNNNNINELRNRLRQMPSFLRDHNNNISKTYNGFWWSNTNIMN